MQGENYNDHNRLITPGGYIGYSLLFAIPVVGLICVLVFSFSSNYPCRKKLCTVYSDHVCYWNHYSSYCNSNGVQFRIMVHLLKPHLMVHWRILNSM